MVFGIVVVVGLGIYSLLGNERNAEALNAPSNKEAKSPFTHEKPEESEAALPIENKEDKVVIEVEKEKPADKEEVPKKDEAAQEGPSEPNFTEVYKEQYGQEEVDQAVTAVGSAITLFLSDEVNPENWKEYAVSSFYKQKINEIERSRDSTKREFESVEVIATQSEEKDKMRFTVFARWNVHIEGQTLNQQSKMFYANTVKNNGKWLVESINGLEEVLKP